MRKFVLVVVLVLAAAAAAHAQTGMTDPGYTVQQGDTLYSLAGLYRGDPVKWQEVLEENPFLQKPGRVFDRNGKVVVLIRPGEKLMGLEKLGIVPAPVPFSELKPAATPLVVEAEAKPDPFLGTNRPIAPAWVRWLILGLLAALGAYTLWKLRNVFRSPGSAGEPIVPGGVRENDPSAIEQRAQQIADRTYAVANPTADLTVARPERVGEIEHGFLNGFGRVAYATGAPQVRHLVNEPAYRARFRFPDRHEEELVFLQACGNDVRYLGIRYLGYTFTRERVAVPAPQPPQPEPEPMRPAAVMQLVRPSASEDTQTTIELAGFLPIAVPEGAKVKVVENGVLLTLPGGGTIALAQAKRRVIREVRTRKVATGDEKE